ncbi:LEA type 2 family protein [Gracilinema caldarium]|uniref:Water Stress and Hypersensitive response domain-containing protein n=1 Tax=Gracilinema caldarium (strain ATCC 51460 / DSM 7334 / H1) TaxID=744872 RepID=F8F2K9_GRAC1|nr:LEA type 2 family protein [Gracilinema caldarium]AEJ19124.1 Water Stress and Hypersensitive response domain-containing protein [Gracilinema caldarium DSM 7334]
MKRQHHCFLLYAVLVSISCTTVKKNDTPPSLTTPEPLPAFSFGNPVLGSAAANSNVPAAVLLQIPLLLDNPGHDRYEIQNLDLQATLYRKDEDRILKPETIQWSPPTEGRPFLDASSSLSGTISFKVPLENILFEHPADSPEAEGTETATIACTVVSLLQNARGEPKKIDQTITIPLPRIYKPQVQIISIAVKRAELINTRLKVRILIKNPNPFPLSLSRFSYELYGNGRFWADGNMADLGTIASNEAQEKDIYLLMNFINMKRDLLDQVIALKSVQYRFHGDVTIGTPFSYLPVFPFTFDRAGNSPVIE